MKKKNVFKKKTDKGEFYFFSKPATKIKTRDLLNQNIHTVLDKIPWKKSMKWGEFSLYWGRPLKSILAVLDGKQLHFKFHHLSSLIGCLRVVDEYIFDNNHSKR